MKVQKKHKAAEYPSYVCKHIFNQTKPILLVSREDGDWQFLCGENHDDEELPHVIGLNHIYEIDPSIISLKNLKKNYVADRGSINDKWKRKKCE